MSREDQIKQELNTVYEIEKHNGLPTVFLFGSHENGFVNIGPILSANLRGVLFAYIHKYKDNLETELKDL